MLAHRRLLWRAQLWAKWKTGAINKCIFHYFLHRLLSQTHCLPAMSQVVSSETKKLTIVPGNAATTTSFLKFNLLYSRTVSWIGVYFLTFSVVIFVFYCFMHFILHFIKWLYLLSVVVYCLHIVKCVRLTCINKRLLTYLLTYWRGRPEEHIRWRCIQYVPVHLSQCNNLRLWSGLEDTGTLNSLFSNSTGCQSLRQ